MISLWGTFERKGQLENAAPLVRTSSRDAKKLEVFLTERANDLTKALGWHLLQTRQILCRLIRDEIVEGRRVPGRIVCTPIDDERRRGYSFVARGSYSRLLGSGTRRRL